MEFYRHIDRKVLPENIQSAIFIEDLPEFCASIYEVMHDDGDHGEMNCLWGVFTVHREVINGGLRFTLPGCPNTLAWTITTGLAPDKHIIDVHMSIRQQTHDPDFIESLEAFIDDWKLGLEQKFSKHPVSINERTATRRL